MLKKFLNVQPSELKFPFQLNKLSIVWVELTNKIDHNVVFKVKTTHPKKYCVRPNVGLISPGSTCVVKVSMQAQKEFPVGLPKDKFLVQSMIAPVGLSAEAITSDMFRKDKDNDVEELKLRVAFVTANPPSPIPEVSEEDFSPEANKLESPDHKNHIMELFDAATSGCELQDQSSKESNTDTEDEDQYFKDSNSTFEPEEKLSQDWDRVCQLIGERTFLMQENQELQYEVEMIRKQIFRSTSNGRNIIPLMLLACFLGFLVGYVIK
ncbi:vesicle-associated protein 1-3-like [Chenopodium quinoa]|uniref:vesicle-associated protein 1-3-like n=1 Tax=Chenopodium quinoa TaxID=63459 RepID=UPI000B7917FB|nr:vesicle-associated protein 1-3-like [Chenopodium quinoa]